MNRMYISKYQPLAEALNSALENDPFYITLLSWIPGEAEKRNALIKYMDYSMTEAEQYGLLYLPAEHNYGASIWSKPLDASTELLKLQQKKAFLKDELGEGALAIYLEIVDFMASKADELIAPDAWYLSIVGLKPEFQGKGLGGGLIKPILDKTDQQNLTTYLETFTPANISFYKRIGYETVASFIEPVTNAKYWIMSRKPLV
ncbi:GNAT family N-acetyltransferase [Mucilaginibacter dorajii]|nr:GNAT family N-acetyltransferase [Mucilaginibacter dorajii]MCS3736216.1 GNAT superfamily N-acetyltransferase [Mucilaginibacter dorajii]